MWQDYIGIIPGVPAAISNHHYFPEFRHPAEYAPSGLRRKPFSGLPYLN
jgi:hypothetical protein